MRELCRCSIVEALTVAKRLCAVSVTFVIGAAGANVAAQSAAMPASARRFELFAEGGGSFPVGGVTWVRVDPACLKSKPPCALVSYFGSRLIEKAGSLFTGVRLGLTRRSAVEARYSYTSIKSVVRLASGPALAIDYNHVNAVAVNYVRSVFSHRRFETFLTGGLGVHYFSSTESTASQLGVNFGGGVDIALAHNVAFRAEIRDFMANQPKTRNPAWDIYDPDRGVNHTVVPSAGIVFRFR